MEIASCETNNKQKQYCEIVHNTAHNCDSFHNCSPITSESLGIRLNKAIANSGYCSRRKADELIKSGQVSLNGLICRDLGVRVGPDAYISVNGELLQYSQKLTYLLLNKPVCTVSTAYDPQGRQTVLDLLPARYRGLRLYPVGRLDYFSEGLLILTNDGNLAHRLMHPRFHFSKRYEVLVRGDTADATLAQFRSGMTLPTGEKLLPVKARAIARPDGNTLLLLELNQGINRQIRRMCEACGLTILKLKRTGQGPLELGDLASGKIRPLSEAEVASLQAALRKG